MKWVLLTAVALFSSSCGECVCKSEGTVAYRLASASQTADGVYLTGTVTWQSCCDPVETRGRAWLVRWDGTTEQGDAAPEQATPVVLTDSGDLVIPSMRAGQQLSVRRSASALLGATQLDIGEVVPDDGSGATIATITIEVDR